MACELLGIVAFKLSLFRLVCHYIVDVADKSKFTVLPFQHYDIGPQHCPKIILIFNLLPYLCARYDVLL